MVVDDPRHHLPCCGPRLPIAQVSAEFLKAHSHRLSHPVKSLSQSWILGAMHGNWKKMKGIKDPEPPDCQSSLSEFYKKQDSYESGNTSGKVEE